MKKYGIVLVTAPTQEEANAIATMLLQEKLAACISCTSIQSFYVWEGEVHNDPEWQLIIKTDLAVFPQLAAKIQAIHSYDVPEIIALPIHAGLTPYLDWIRESVIIKN